MAQDYEQKFAIGSGCFAAGTRILMANASYKNIEDIQPGDRVLNKDGEPVTVVNAWCTGEREVMALRHTASCRETYVTPDHCYLVGDLTSVSAATIRDIMLLPRHITFELPQSFEIDLCDFAVRQKKQLARYKTTIADSYELGYIFGTFLGDGHAFIARSRNSVTGRVSWYFATHEQDTIEKLVRCLKDVTGVDVEPTPGKNITSINLYSLQWARLLAQCGKRHEKHLLTKYLSSNRSYLRGLFEGLVDSDGHIAADGRLSFHNTSQQLVELFNILCYLLEGSFPNCETEEASAGGLKSTSAEKCRVSFRSRLNVSHEKRLMANYQAVKRLEGYSSSIIVPVYDIETDCPTQSFIADNAIVHNSLCTTRAIVDTSMPQITTVYEGR